ncbi:MAG TPA: hypothetical protein VK658_07325 [Chryseolinea sp.]|nr:hypothetical protein [Chryseolinea sp.]
MRNWRYILAIVLGLALASCEEFVIEPHEDDPVDIPPPPPPKK